MQVVTINSLQERIEELEAFADAIKYEEEDAPSIMKHLQVEDNLVKIY
jgi:hypothetical protein